MGDMKVDGTGSTSMIQHVIRRPVIVKASYKIWVCLIIYAAFRRSQVDLKREGAVPDYILESLISFRGCHASRLKHDYTGL